MAATDAVSVFAEGTFEEQIKELVQYLARGRSDEERVAYTKPFEDLLVTEEGQKPFSEDAERRKQVVAAVLKEVKGFGEGSEKEIEGFLNLLISHFLSLFPINDAETKEQLKILLQTIASGEDQITVKHRILSNLYNALPRTSALRLLVHRTLLQVASASDDLDTLHLSLPEVQKWTSEWEISAEEKIDYLKLLVDVYSKSGDSETTYQYKLFLAESLEPSSAKDAVLDVIATALRLPNVFDFDSVYRLQSIISADNSPLFSLLQIFLNDGLAEYKTWESSNQGVLTQFELDAAQLERKIRLLSLTTLAFQNVGRDLQYTTIASALQIEPTQVEAWVINVIRSGLVSGKLSQTSQTFHIVRASSRAFERIQWEALEKRLVSWKSSIGEVLEVVVSTKRKNTSTADAPASSSTAGAQEASGRAQTATA